MARAEFYGYATDNIGYCRPSPSAAFRAQPTGERVNDGLSYAQTKLWI